MGGFFTGFLIFSLLCTVNLFLLTLLGAVRLLPAVAPVVSRVLLAILVLSLRLYIRLLTPLSAPAKRTFGLDLLTGLWRLLACCGLSLVIGSILLFVIGWGPSLWTILICIAHGLFVDLTWDDGDDGGGIRMGGRIPWDH